MGTLNKIYFLSYLNFNTICVTARQKIIKLEIQIGLLSFANPYSIHKKTPVVKKTNIPIETSFADFVFNVFKTCGINAIVVKDAAKYPRISI